MFSSNPRHLSSFLRGLRFDQGLSFGDLARKMGAVNVSKTASKIASFEHGNDIAPDLLGRVIEALDAAPEEVRKHTTLDRKAIRIAFDAPGHTEVCPMLIVRIMPAVYRRVPVPDEIIGRKESIRWAQDQARHLKRKVCLELSRKESIWITKEGLVLWEQVREPVYPEFLGSHHGAE